MIARTSRGLAVLATFAAIAACAGAGGPAPAGGAPTLASPPPTPMVASVSAKPAACARQRPAACAGPPPSYAHDVAPLVERRCASCHANGGSAAEDHDFSKVATLQAQKSAVLAQVGACAMPPRGAAGLAPEEADILLRWLACDAPRN